MRASELIIADIEAFSPTDHDWRPLDGLLAEFWRAGVLPQHLPALFGVFERYPTEDGAGVFWAIVHGVEALPFDYESELLASVHQMPSEFNTLMVHRIANTGQATVAGRSVDDIYLDVLLTGGLPAGVRSQVEDFVACRKQGPLPD